MNAVSVALAILAVLLAGNLFLLWKTTRVREQMTRRIAAKMSDTMRQNADAFDRVVLMYEDLIRRDPQIAEPLEISRLEVIAGQKRMREGADAMDKFANTGTFPWQREHG